MKVINLPRGHGKTLTLIQEADRLWKEGVFYIVCPTRTDALQIAEEAHRAGKEIRFPITFREFLHGMPGIKADGYLIDDLDRCLKVFNPMGTIKMISITKE